jgi:hypothetical protein
VRTRLLLVFVVALLVGALVIISGPSQAFGPIAKLRRRVVELENRVGALESSVYPCFFVEGVSQFGDPNGTHGYVYSDDGVNEFLTSALDFDDSGAPQVWSLVVAPECVARNAGEGQGLYTPLKSPDGFKPKMKTEP